MLLLDTKKQMAKFRQNYHQQKIALVATMGGLHQGHLVLIDRANQLADKVVVSIFVNPAQFSEGEDLINYPRNIKKDIDILKKYKVAALFMPSNLEINPKDNQIPINFNFGYLSTILCAKYRKNFLSGVAKVICQLFNIIQPNIAVFGQKDYQQLKMIESLVCLLNYPIKIVSIPIVRAENNLALSSRNQYLSHKQKQKAAHIYQTLITIKRQINNHKQIKPQNIKAIENLAVQLLEKQGFKLNYFCLLNYPDLMPIDNKTKKMIALVAVFLDGIRLIDNQIIDLKS